MVQRAYRYRVTPTPEQETLLRRTLGCVRLVFNKALVARREAWEERQESINYGQTSALLTTWKQQEGLEFLNEVSCVPLQQTLRHLQTAFGNFFAKRAKYPRFKKKRSGGSAEFTRSAFRWKDGQVWLAKCIQPLNIIWSRMLPDGCTPTTITVRLDAAGRWFVSLLVEDSTIQPLPVANKQIGLDAGITSLITTSNGEKVANPKHFERLGHKLRRVQKALSRCQKGSSNREKARGKVAKVQSQITNARKDFLHQLTTQLVRENQTIAVEDLAVRNMVKNRKLARSISDAAWGELVRQLEYKCQWYGRMLVKIDRWFPSSKRCGNCGQVVDKLPLSIREWTCPHCGMHHDRDVNAAQNILAAGLAVVDGNVDEVCGANIRPDRHKYIRQLRRPEGACISKTRKGKKQKLKS
ncbi:RNA-guided endonuclease InsQ/TnpB family protein [Gloeocapsopsis dulcis]|uniref:Transposase n=1 Tax=Gloeocapsopsis dulcis AAB1 = 1H9 TaxID=1433147 RepID=A0A6N8FWL1_9CHRO|nr:RNA-guided endonuclease TnpB family protein [Gloeocapsopsis dulcis]MUL36336.1 transposase [Gloeocapsopsis dulcis AAB1 = 1H9]WNN88168.1 RNA-guided endonuclease TnpB family protein [Gloeocapsopsis dulcis]